MACGKFSGGSDSGGGVFGLGGGSGGPGIRGVGHIGVHGIAGSNDLDVGVLAEAGLNGTAFFAISGAAGEGGIAAQFTGDVLVDPNANLLTIDHDLAALNGNFSLTGIKSAVVPFPEGSHRKRYCLESPESWFEDFGSAQLIDGRARVELDPDFATTINTHAYHVFIAEYDDSNRLFVTNRTSTGFEVRAKTSAKTAAFSYRVVARRKDIAPARFAKMTLPTRSPEEIKTRFIKRA
jgi:hypothetical protein